MTRRSNHNQALLLTGINEGSIVFDCRPFDNRTFDFVRFAKLLCEFDLVRFPNRIERLLFDFVRCSQRSIRYAGNKARLVEKLSAAKHHFKGNHCGKKNNG